MSKILLYLLQPARYLFQLAAMITQQLLLLTFDLPLTLDRRPMGSGLEYRVKISGLTASVHRYSIFET